MKKRMTKLLSLLLAAACVFSGAVLCASAEEETPDTITIPYSKISCGTVDKHPTCTITKDFEKDGKKVTKVVPTPDTADGAISLDAYTIKNVASVDISVYKFVSVEYYYESEKPLEVRPLIGIMKNGGIMSASVQNLAPTNGVLKANEWSTAYFYYGEKTDKNLDRTSDCLLRQMHFQPFGSTHAKGLSADEAFYVGDVTFYKKNPDASAKVKVQYVKGDPGALGNMADEEVTYGTSFTFPECAYELEDAAFAGWKSSLDNKIYPAGTSVVLEQSIALTAQWELLAQPDGFVSLSFPKYHDGSVNKKANVEITNVTEDGIESVRVVPLTTESGALTVDGYHYQGAGVDISNYNYVYILYKYLSDAPIDTTMRLGVMKNGGILDASQYYRSEDKISTGSWRFASFDISSVHEHIVEGTQPIIRQLHVAPLGDIPVETMHENDMIFVANVMFFNERPNIETREPYMTGYSDGTFRPNNTMTRAEACTVVARVTAGGDGNISGLTTDYTDVAPEAWYAKYVGYCRNNGFLAGFPAGAFDPEKEITRAELAELVYNTSLAKGSGSVAFSDVTADHPKYVSIMAAAGAGLINGYSDGTFKPDNTITRAEVVTIINRALGRDTDKSMLSKDVLYTFRDVDVDYWAFPQIAEATLGHLVFEGKWVGSLTEPSNFITKFTPDYAAADAKIAELDALSEQRKAEIRSTASDLSRVTGKTYYVSNDGSDANDGLTPETAIQTLNAAGRISTSEGDAILFRRGDIFRGTLAARKGVTYSAYGEGAKPILTTSPENGADPSKWTLVEGSTNIWKYANTSFRDVGVIIFNEGEAWTYKEMPDYRNDMYTLRGTETPFDMFEQMDKDLDMFHDSSEGVATGGVPKRADSNNTYLYVRSDLGNPGSRFSSIEFAYGSNCISVGTSAENVLIDNLCIKYTGCHGIGAGTVKNLTVQNCEFGWIGGSMQHYNESDAAKKGTLTRYGNAIEVYGGCEGYNVINNYIYQVYDAGITHQHSGGVQMNDVLYKDNLVEYCTYCIEYFNGQSADGARSGNNILFDGNILRNAGYGFGNQRYNPNNDACIKGWSNYNEFENFEMRNNVFDRSNKWLLHVGTIHKAYLPKMSGNTYIQNYGGAAYIFGTSSATFPYDATVEMQIKYVLGDKAAQIYYTR